jgi:hypothetical protein
VTRWLRTLMSGVVVLALHGAGAASAAPATGSAAPATGSAAPAAGSAASERAATRGPATMSAVPGEPVQDERPRRTIGQDVRRSKDSNAAYLGVAAAVLGAMVWWNRRRRDRFEREDRGAAERGHRPETPDGPERRDSP